MYTSQGAMLPQCFDCLRKPMSKVCTRVGRMIRSLKRAYGVEQPDRDTPCLAALLIVMGERSTRDCAMLPLVLLLARHCMLRKNPKCACLKSPGAHGGVRRRQCHRCTPRLGAVNHNLRSCRAMLRYPKKSDLWQSGELWLACDQISNLLPVPSDTPCGSPANGPLL